MSLLTTIGRLFRHSMPHLRELANRVHSEVEMRAILEREHLRADRGNSPFVFAVFTPAEHFHSNANFDWRLSIIASRLRSTDVIGRIHQKKVGCLLLDTGPDGARPIIENMNALLGRQRIEGSWEVLVYPHSISQAANFDANDRRLTPRHFGESTLHGSPIPVDQTTSGQSGEAFSI